MVNTNLTCLQGEIHIGFYDLVDMFGEPEDVSSTGKSDVQWAIEIDGVVATIYNWKNGPAYTGDDSIEVERIHDWNIGGHSQSAVSLVLSKVQDYVYARKKIRTYFVVSGGES
jgi:hypothetical protein